MLEKLALDGTKSQEHVTIKQCMTVTVKLVSKGMATFEI